MKSLKTLFLVTALAGAIFANEDLKDAAEKGML